MKKKGFAEQGHSEKGLVNIVQQINIMDVE